MNTQRCTIPCIIVSSVSILTRGAAEKVRIDGEMERQVVAQEKYVLEGKDLTMKRISLQHGTRDWMTVK